MRMSIITSIAMTVVRFDQIQGIEITLVKFFMNMYNNQIKIPIHPYLFLYKFKIINDNSAKSFQRATII